MTSACRYFFVETGAYKNRAPDLRFGNPVQRYWFFCAL